MFNRPNEIDELLESLTQQDFQEKYEILIVEDGSQECSKEIVKKYKKQLNISYFYKPNSGPGDSRNFGMLKAKGNYFIILDSDVILPSKYLSTVNTYLENHYLDCFGGADTVHKSFSNLQKAINHVMTSFLTTGGIRGVRKVFRNLSPEALTWGFLKKPFKSLKDFLESIQEKIQIYPNASSKLVLQLVFYQELRYFINVESHGRSFMIK